MEVKLTNLSPNVAPFGKEPLWPWNTTIPKLPNKLENAMIFLKIFIFGIALLATGLWGNWPSC